MEELPSKHNYDFIYSMLIYTSLINKSVFVIYASVRIQIMKGWNISFYIFFYFYYLCMNALRDCFFNVFIEVIKLISLLSEDWRALFLFIALYTNAVLYNCGLFCLLGKHKAGNSAVQSNHTV